MHLLKSVLNSSQLSILLLLVVIVVVFGRSLGNQFVMDDFDQIVNWSQLRFPTENLGYFIKGGLPLEQLGTYRPLRSLLLLLSFQVFGTNPLGYHAISLALHWWCTALVYLIVYRTSRHRPISLTAGLLFALHPVHVEAVAWISASFDHLLAISLLLTSFYLYALGQKRQRYRVGSYLTALLAFFGNELVLVLPILIAWHEFIIKRHHWRQIIKTTLPYLLLAALYWLVRLSLKLPAHETSVIGTNPLITILTMSVAVFKYAILSVLPPKLHFNHHIIGGIRNTFPNDYYPGMSIDWPTLTTPLVLISLIFIVVTLILCWRYRRQHKLLVFFIGWWGISLLPFSQLFPAGKLMAERYLYLASLGSSTALALLLWRYWPKRLDRRLRLGLIALICVWYGYQTWRYIPEWRDSLTFWQYQLQHSPSSALTHNELSSAYWYSGDLEQSKIHLLKAVELNPESADYIANLALLSLHEGDLATAVELNQQAISTRPHRPRPYIQLGDAYQLQGDYQQATEAYNQALEIKPDSMEAQINLSSALARTGELTEAEALLQQVTLKFLDRHEGFLAYGQFLVTTNRYDEARPMLMKALELKPTSEPARKLLETIP